MNPNYPTFNVTFSTQFLSILTKTMKTVKKEILPIHKGGGGVGGGESASEDEDSLSASCVSDMSIEGENISHVSPYTVRNETGFQLEVTTDLRSQHEADKRRMSSYRETLTEQRVYSLKLKNNEEKNFQVDLREENLPVKETHVFKRSSEQVKVRVNVPNENLAFVEQIDLDKVLTKIRPCKSAVTGKKVFELLTEVRLDPISSKKILSISSPYYFINDCYRTVYVALFDSAKNLI